jgi:hypothetical protein
MLAPVGRTHHKGVTMESATRAPRAQQSRRRSRTRVAALLTAALTLAVTASALAAHPKPGRKYSGATSEQKVEGFSAPVTFSVSADGTKLLRFTYGSLGCSGAGGFRPGVSPFTGAALDRVGTINLAANGHFAISNAESTLKFKGGSQGKLVTTTAVTGRFTSAKQASGQITFSQDVSLAHQKPFGCGPVTFKFKAKLKRG